MQSSENREERSQITENDEELRQFKEALRSDVQNGKGFVLLSEPPPPNNVGAVLYSELPGGRGDGGGGGSNADDRELAYLRSRTIDEEMRHGSTTDLHDKCTVEKIRAFLKSRDQLVCEQSGKSLELKDAIIMRRDADKVLDFETNAMVVSIHDDDDDNDDNDEQFDEFRNGLNGDKDDDKQYSFQWKRPVYDPYAHNARLHGFSDLGNERFDNYNDDDATESTTIIRESVAAKRVRSVYDDDDEVRPKKRRADPSSLVEDILAAHTQGNGSIAKCMLFFKHMTSPRPRAGFERRHIAYQVIYGAYCTYMASEPRLRSLVEKSDPCAKALRQVAQPKKDRINMRVSWHIYVSNEFLRHARAFIETLSKEQRKTWGVRRLTFEPIEGNEIVIDEDGDGDDDDSAPVEQPNEEEQATVPDIFVDIPSANDASMSLRHSTGAMLSDDDADNGGGGDAEANIAYERLPSHVTFWIGGDKHSSIDVRSTVAVRRDRIPPSSRLCYMLCNEKLAREQSEGAYLIPIVTSTDDNEADTVGWERAVRRRAIMWVLTRLQTPSVRGDEPMNFREAHLAYEFIKQMRLDDHVRSVSLFDGTFCFGVRVTGAFLVTLRIDPLPTRVACDAEGNEATTYPRRVLLGADFSIATSVQVHRYASGAGYTYLVYDRRHDARAQFNDDATVLTLKWDTLGDIVCDGGERLCPNAAVVIQCAFKREIVQSFESLVLPNGNNDNDEVDISESVTAYLVDRADKSRYSVGNVALFRNFGQGAIEQLNHRALHKNTSLAGH